VTAGTGMIVLCGAQIRRLCGSAHVAVRWMPRSITNNARFQALEA
jgi:hypothetical protein